MRLAILTRDFPPKRFGGTETGSYELARFLAKRGHKVVVVTTWDSSLPKKSVEHNFLIYRLRFWRNKVWRFPGLVIFSIRTIFILRKFKPDLIHGQSIYMGVPALVSKIFIRKPYIIWLQGSDIYLQWLFQAPISRLVLSRADAVISLTGDMRKELLKFCNRDSYVIPNGVDLDKFGCLSREEARRKLRLKVESKIIIFVGILYHIKGVRYLIEAMQAIKQEYPDAQLLIVGDGVERCDLEALVQKLNLRQCVTFTGLVPNKSVSEYLCASDLFVLPSLSEGFPVTFLEAMACGLPIITTRIRGLSEIINDCENGFIVEPRSSTEIAEKALFILGNENIRERISQNNKERIKNYSWESIVSNLEEVYYKIIRCGKRNQKARVRNSA